MPEQQKNNRRQRQQQPVDNTYGHLQPQALDIERAVLGALLVDKDAYPVVCEILHPESFYEPRHQMIYTAIRDLSMAERPVDILTVAEQLAKSGQLEEAGGPAYITDISRSSWLVSSSLLPATLRPALLMRPSTLTT